MSGDLWTRVCTFDGRYHVTKYLLEFFKYNIEIVLHNILLFYTRTYTIWRVWGKDTVRFIRSLCYDENIYHDIYESIKNRIN